MTAPHGPYARPPREEMDTYATVFGIVLEPHLRPILRDCVDRFYRLTVKQAYDRALSSITARRFKVATVCVDVVREVLTGAPLPSSRVDRPSYAINIAKVIERQDQPGAAPVDPIEMGNQEDRLEFILATFLYAPRQAAERYRIRVLEERREAEYSG